MRMLGITIIHASGVVNLAWTCSQNWLSFRLWNWSHIDDEKESSKRRQTSKRHVFQYRPIYVSIKSKSMKLQKPNLWDTEMLTRGLWPGQRHRWRFRDLVVVKDTFEWSRASDERRWAVGDGQPPTDGHLRYGWGVARGQGSSPIIHGVGVVALAGL